MKKLAAAGAAAIAVLTYVIAFDQSNIVSTVAQKAIDLIKFALPFLN